MFACFMVQQSLTCGNCVHLIVKVMFVGYTQLGLTGMVPTAPGGAPSPPRAVELDGVPVAQAVVTQSIWSQVADL